jgi:CheY-like chemotaxis protein
LEGGREVKIAALTAPASGSAREEVLAAGLDDFVRKPFRREDVFDCLARHLGVRYRGPEPATGGQGDVLGRLRPEALTALPSELRRKLEDAVLSLHPERIMFAIEEVSVADETLAAVLRRLANQFAYTEILDAIQHGALEAASGPAN